MKQRSDPEMARASRFFMFPMHKRNTTALSTCCWIACVEKTKRIKSFQRRSGIGMFRFRSVAKTIFIAFPASVAFLCGEQVINRLLLSFA
jgi:hypothetical protein